MTRHSRRHFLRGGLALAGIGLLAGCGAVHLPWERPSKVPRIGILQVTPQAEPEPANRAFLAGLHALGYVEGRDITFDWRYSEARADRFPALAAELAGIPVDVIVTAGPAAIGAAKEATATIPIVMASSGDPVGGGLVASLARPGGNVTGLTNLAPEQSGKRLQLLAEAVPGLAHVATLWNAANPAKQVEFQQLQAAAAGLGVEIRSVAVRAPDDIDAALEAAAQQRPDALVVLQDGLISGLVAQQVADFATGSRLPTMGESTVFTTVGGMMAYGASALDLHRRAATYVDKILKGAKPADLPVERPTRFDFAINLRTAQVVGLTIPDRVLRQATEVIQ